MSEITNRELAEATAIVDKIVAPYVAAGVFSGGIALRLCGELVQALTARQPREAGGWRKCSEGVPEDSGVPVLVWQAGWARVLCVEFAAGRWWLGATRLADPPTHWMPLPQPPGEEKCKHTRKRVCHDLKENTAVKVCEDCHRVFQIPDVVPPPVEEKEHG